MKIDICTVQKGDQAIELGGTGRAIDTHCWFKYSNAKT